MHEQRVDRLRVVRRARGVSLRGNRKRGRERHDEGHEHESAIPHREAQHRCYRREQNLRKPIAAELNRRQELGEPGTKGCATRERQPRDVGVREDHRGCRGDGGERGGTRGDVHRDARLLRVARERPHDHDERADHAGHADVHERARDRHAVTHQVTRVEQHALCRSAADPQGNEQRGQSEGHQHRGGKNAERSRHPSSLSDAA